MCPAAGELVNFYICSQEKDAVPSGVSAVVAVVVVVARKAVTLMFM